MAARFIGREEHAEVSVLIVTFQSAASLMGLLESLRVEAKEHRIRVVVADNHSSDGTVDLARSVEDVVVIATGGNLGYAAGVNAALKASGESDAILILNPDLIVEPGCIAALRRRMRESAADLVVPMLVDTNGRRTDSLRREPTILRTFGDATFGRLWRRRPGFLSDTVRDPAPYRSAHQVDWATGAALLIDREVADVIGPWDERFFLYSEETDYFRRARKAGFVVWYEPAAVVVHEQGGSGSSDGQVALAIVNEVRYAEKHHPRSAVLFKAAIMLRESRRWRDPTHDLARAALRDRRLWDSLPGPSLADPTLVSSVESAQPEASRPGSSLMKQDADALGARHPTADASIDHVLVTRFNLPSPGPESLIRARQGWLRDRVGLFERFTVPSVRQQSTRAFTWIVYFDVETPSWLVERLAPLVAEGVFTPIYRETVGWEDVSEDAHRLTGALGDMLITTNLDNDDAIAVDFLERVQQRARPRRREAIYLGNGLICMGNRAYLRHDRDNAFCSVAEPWDGAVTAWRDWHILLRGHMPIATLDGPPSWLQIVHGRNVSNRVRGRLVDPSVYRNLFPGLLDDMPVPTRGELLADQIVARPLREVRELVRRVGRQAVLILLGKTALNRIKERLGRLRG